MQLEERFLRANGVKLRAMVAGTGPPVLFVHGFPESWYSWRHQLLPIAASGFQVCAIDVRGYGASDKPGDVAAYTLEQLVDDALAVIDALDRTRPAVLIGHDWGAPIVWNAALAAPHRVRAVAGLSVPPLPPPARPLDEILDERFTRKQRFHYQVYFAQQGRAEAEFDADVRSTLRRLYYSASGDAPPGSWSNKAFGARLLDGVPDPSPFPSWLTASDIDYLVGEFSRDGFRAPLNRYRTARADFEYLQTLRDRKIEQPSLYIGGTQDLVLSLIPNGDPCAAMHRQARDVRGVHMLTGCGHWTQQERPAEVTRLLTEFLQMLA